MKDNLTLNIVARIKSDFPTKFGIPRQSGLINELKSYIIFEPEYQKEEAIRGIEGFSHLWLLWKFSENVTENPSLTVRPPRLGGNTRLGVFATRSPFRPNPIGLSSVKLEKIIKDEKYGFILEVSGADLLDGTPIYDIKPYIPYTDSHPEATGGFSSDVMEDLLEVTFDNSLQNKVNEEKISALIKVLKSDPRPAYQNDPARIYSFEFSNLHIEFKVKEKVLTVISINEIT